LLNTLPLKIPVQQKEERRKKERRQKTEERRNMVSFHFAPNTTNVSPQTTLIPTLIPYLFAIGRVDTICPMPNRQSWPPPFYNAHRVPYDWWLFHPCCRLNLFGNLNHPTI
jgi:hypothetical protein